MAPCRSTSPVPVPRYGDLTPIAAGFLRSNAILSSPRTTRLRPSLSEMFQASQLESDTSDNKMGLPRWRPKPRRWPFAELSRPNSWVVTPSQFALDSLDWQPEQLRQSEPLAMSVFRDNRTTPTVVDTRRDQIDVLMDSVGTHQSACGANRRDNTGRGKPNGSVAHEHVIVFDAEGPIRRKAKFKSGADVTPPPTLSVYSPDTSLS